MKLLIACLLLFAATAARADNYDYWGTLSNGNNVEGTFNFDNSDPTQSTLTFDLFDGTGTNLLSSGNDEGIAMKTSQSAQFGTLLYLYFQGGVFASNLCVDGSGCPSVSTFEGYDFTSAGTGLPFALPAPLPEPASLALMATALLGLGIRKVSAR